jgi:ferrochelatase
MIEWTQPNATFAAQNLIDLGATSLVFMPIGFATENHETLLDVEHIISGLRRKRPDVTYVQMPCVNDHPLFLEMAAGWTHDQIAALLEADDLAVDLSMAAVQAQEVHGHHHSGHHHHHGHDHDHAHQHPEKVHTH